MKVFHNNGKIASSIYDKDLFSYTQYDEQLIDIFEIDEVNPNNKQICKELQLFGSDKRLDSNGDSKYYIEAGGLYERDGWEEQLEINS